MAVSVRLIEKRAGVVEPVRSEQVQPVIRVVARGSGRDGEVRKTGVRRVERELCRCLPTGEVHARSPKCCRRFFFADRDRRPANLHRLAAHRRRTSSRRAADVGNLANPVGTHFVSEGPTRRVTRIAALEICGTAVAPRVHEQIASTRDRPGAGSRNVTCDTSLARPRS